MVGRIIGKEGANINSIQNLSLAHVTVAPACEEGSTKRKITITGSRSQIEYAIRLIRNKEDETSAPGIPLPEAGQGDPTNQVTTKTIFVPDEEVGRVIGKGGSTIRHIQDLSSAHLDIAKECPPGSRERPITVTGNPQQIAHCEELLQTKLRGEPLPQLAVPDTAKFEKKVYIPDAMVGRFVKAP